MKYRHIREWDYAAESFLPGGATLAHNTMSGVIGISVCSSNDQFCKKTGRMEAEKRTYNHVAPVGDYTIIVAPRVSGGREWAWCVRAIIEAVQMIVLNSDVPVFQLIRE